MKSQANSLQAQLDFHKTRAEQMSAQLLPHQIKDDDSDYELKRENEELKGILSYWVQHAKKLEIKIKNIDDEQEDLNNILDQNSNIIVQDDNVAECMSINQPQASYKSDASKLEQKYQVVNTTPVKDRAHTLPRKIDVQNFFARCALTAPLMSPMSEMKSNSMNSNERILFDYEN